MTRGGGISFEFVDKLIELVEIDSGLEAERVWNGPRCRVVKFLRVLAETGAERPIDQLIERHPEFASTSLQESSQIVIDGERDAHKMTCHKFLMSRHHILIETKPSLQRPLS